MAGATLAGEAAFRASLARAVAVAAFSVAIRIFTVYVTGFRFAVEVTIRTRSAGAIAIGALTVALGIVPFAIDMAGRGVALKFALLARLTDAVAAVTVAVPFATGQQ